MTNSVKDIIKQLPIEMVIDIAIIEYILFSRESVNELFGLQTN